ncbi:vacuolar amino acid transporter 1-like isoform X2 [Iris pallida]|uniref:Vacuolar amino acid transporter 1-like isoform X2 n=1 Tax=Iris pallida TaxID=29817 RepID=A0AAX6GQD1_IRIPA|nr:vacuolar amino acid transporter 1-like isoform X2 [Iris pallida]
MANPIDVPSSPSSQKTADDLEQPLLLPLSHSQSTSKGVTFLRTCFNSTNALSGIGVLSMPYALSQGGWLSLALFFVVVVICFYTGLLIQRCMDADRCIKTYPEVGQLAFGYKGRLAIAIFMYLELYLVGVSLLILEGDNMDKMFPNTCVEFGSVSIKGKQLFVILSSMVILPTTWSRNLTVVAYFSVIGVIASVLLLGSLLWTGIADAGFHWKGRALNMSGLPTTLGLYFVCFTSHAVFPTIYASMKEKTRFPKVLVISFVLCTFNYGLVAVLGYLMYGDEVESQVTLNLHAGKLYSKIAIYATFLTPFAKYALTITPVAMAIEDKLTFYGISPVLLVRTLLLISTMVFALTVPFFGYVMTFIGSFLSIIISVLFPCICYLKINKSSMKLGIETVGITCIVIVGVVIAIMGTYSSVREIINSM